MPSLQVLISTESFTMKASQNFLKQRQYIFPRYQLSRVSRPGRAPVVGVCVCCVSPRCLHPSLASHMRRRTVGVVVVLLLLLSGDVETNPGPVGELRSLLQYDISLTSHTLHKENGSGPTALAET